MPKNEAAIVVKNLHKDFTLPQHKNTSIKHAVVNITRKNGITTQRVLDGVSFEVNKGDFFGIVGRNGSGKSTLLKILAGVYSPSAGDIAVNGKLTPFIELGVGFNPELSGRDNVYLNGALLGFDRKDMDAMYQEIVDFAELEQFMDQKLKNYSSGMQVRLAFSIAIKARNEILIFDEVLAVGDEAFQRKCLDVFEQYKANRQTIILVTHDMDTVKKFCNRAILISDGKIIREGEPYTVANEYSRLNQEEIDRNSGVKAPEPTDSGLHLDIVNLEGKKKSSFQIGEPLVASLSWEKLPKVESIGINVFKESGEHITGFNSRYSVMKKNWQQTNNIKLQVKLDITKGKYYLLVEVFGENGKVVDSIIEGPRFSVVSNQGLEWSGLVELNHAWLD
jgi:ABC-2 type transport system ATP-binding protein